MLNTINRIAQATNFQGTKLLNGSLDYTTSSVGTSAFNAMQINAAKIADGSKLSVAVQVVASARTGEIDYTGGAISGNAVTLEIAGNLGTEQLTFDVGTTIASMASAINGIKKMTGVSAVVSTTTLRLNTTAVAPPSSSASRPSTAPALPV